MRWMLGHSSLHLCLGQAMQQSACPTDIHPTRAGTSASTNMRRILTERLPFLQPSSHNSTNESPLPGKRLKQPLGRRAAVHVGTRLATGGKTGGADDIGGDLPPTSRWPACGSGCPRKRRTRAYGGALRAYDKNRRHPIPAIFALGQYGAVNVAESGHVRK